MSLIISPYLPFPPAIWWAKALQAGTVLLDGAEHFEKATARNRYSIATANGRLQLSIPLRGGRGQRSAMQDVMIDNTVRWQDQHWRSIFSAYGRAPFFEHFAPELEALFLRKTFTQLIHFSTETTRWLNTAVRAGLDLQPTDIFIKNHEGALYDWRFGHAKSLGQPLSLPQYPQVFDATYPFIPNLSLLDLVMNEGPAAGPYLRRLEGRGDSQA